MCICMLRCVCIGMYGGGGDRVCRYMTKAPKYGNTVTSLRMLLPIRLRARKRTLRLFSTLKKNLLLTSEET